MRIKLEPHYQKQLFLDAKGSGTWGELAKKLNIQKGALDAYYYDGITLPNNVYNKIKNKYSGKFVLDKLKDNWGKVKGGHNSLIRNIELGHKFKQLQQIRKPVFNKKLAELVGIMLGDGCVVINPAHQVYNVRIASNLKTEKQYRAFTQTLMTELFGVSFFIKEVPKSNVAYVCSNSKELVLFFLSIGVFQSSIKQKIGVPAWIKCNPEFYVPCIRGLIDTDGSIYRLSRRDAHLLRISFKSANPCFSLDLREMLIKLGFHPSKLTNLQIHLTRKEDILKYIREIGFNNLKNTQRYYEFSSSPVV